MKRSGIYLLFILTLVIAPACKLFFASPEVEKEQKGIVPEEEDNEPYEDPRRAAYIERMHRAAPGTNWRAIEEANATNAYYSRAGLQSKTTSTFAGGALTGYWHERGINNICGRINLTAFDSARSILYVAADGGSIWKTPIGAINWQLVSDVAKFNSYTLACIPRSGGGTRLFTSTGTKVWFTDNDGLSFDTSTGIRFPISWSPNTIKGIYPVNDAAHTIYCHAWGWDSAVWATRNYLYASTDSGRSFRLLRTFSFSGSESMDFFSPLGSASLYALGVRSTGADTLFAVNASIVSVSGASNSIDATHSKIDMKCMTSGGVTHFYAMTNNRKIYHSTNGGVNWLLKDTLTTDGWILGLSQQSPNAVFYGNVEAYRSSDSGATFTRVNTWGSYYADVANKLHADLRSFSFYKNSATGAEFGLITNDGGAWISNDLLNTVSNITLTGIHVSQYWDHISHPTDTNVIVPGAQDQGLQHTLAGWGYGIFDGTQVISGDYGQLRITGTGGATLWPEYPGGNFYLYNSLTTAPAYIGSYTIDGTQKPNAAWMLATSPYYNSATNNVILVGGGEIHNDSGSYLVRLKLEPSSTFSVTPYQYNYNFRRHSHDSVSGISAIGISKLSNLLMYVATEDGTFFYSTDSGANWQLSDSFVHLRGDWLYGATICASADSVDKVYFGGSGYNNPPVFVSHDHGRTFYPMSTGLPSTLVYRIVTYSNDSFLFAATEAGPYVYVKAANRWYSLSEPKIPAVNWRSVEYIAATRTVRFGTYGRGIWDLSLRTPTSGIKEAEPQSPAITLAPNPVVAGMPIRLLSNIAQEIDFTLIGIDGKVVHRQRCTTNSPLYLPLLPAGVYTCIIEQNGATTRQKLLIE